VKLKLDENIPATTAPRLVALGFDADTVLDEKLGGRPHNEVWAAAQAERRFLVTQDLDFSDSRKFEPGSHAGILIARLPDAEQWRIGDYVVGWLSSPDANTWQGALIVATPTKLRVLRPPTP